MKTKKIKYLINENNQKWKCVLKKQIKVVIERLKAKKYN